MNDDVWVTFDQIAVALQATNPPIRWSRQSLLRLGQSDRERSLPNVRGGNRLAEVYWSRRTICEYVLRNFPRHPFIARDFAAALDAEIKKAANADTLGAESQKASAANNKKKKGGKKLG